ncbi:VIT1/CCC1 transporter family protein [uncultured Brevibacterium sp.]|uniref:VIT1/CCC1 transporter family protein n=1 Tax=uncultured Brevibacterium sp. TaxID=189678 RepID=UPI0025D4C4C6|nr:VIT1/CCC1 transporter family protein [uncultured Brevibacterium sp.]
MNTQAQDIRRWKKHLANERVEERVYRSLAQKRQGEEREILLELADAERRHQDHWISRLGEHANDTVRPSLNIRLLAFMARLFGSIFVLALAQQAETRSPYDHESGATPQMVADERVHAEVVRALAAKSRARMSGNFRAAIFGANDGLVSNVALVLGVGAAGVSPHIVLLTGVSGLLAGALSMAAGEYISVSSQRELIEAGNPHPRAADNLNSLDINANELALVFRARGMDAQEADLAARTAISKANAHGNPTFLPKDMASNDTEDLGTAMGAAMSSFVFFATGAIIPILPYIFGMQGIPAMVVSAVLVGIALMFTGGAVGVLSGKAPTPRAFRQLAIGYGAALVTILLGMLFGTVAG